MTTILSDFIHLQSLPVAFSELMKPFQIVLTLLITTAFKKRFFLSLNIKNMSEDNNGQREPLNAHVCGERVGEMF